MTGVRNSSLKVLGVRKISKISEVYAMYQNWCSLSLLDNYFDTMNLVVLRVKKHKTD